MQKKALLTFVIAIFLFLASGGISYFIFSNSISKRAIAPAIPVKKLASGGVMFDDSLPKTEPCPLTGVKYSTQQRDWWESHEPLGVMIENSSDARPQSGISFADNVYEAVAEGGITRTLNIFYCQDAPQIGPIRSARIYFLDMLRQYGKYPLYAHVGGANADGPADALGEISDLGWTGYNDLDQFAIGFPVYWRDYNRLGHPVATEHTMYSTTSKLWDYAKANRQITSVTNAGQWDANFTKYTFKDDAQLSARPASQAIHIEFWGDEAYNVDWKYDRKNNIYLRNNGGVPHIDKDTNQQLSTKNLIVLFMRQSNANDGYMNNEHLLYQDTGSGKASIFMDGKQFNATWQKSGPTGRLLIYDQNGSAIQFNRGKLWYTILPLTGILRVQ